LWSCLATGDGQLCPLYSECRARLRGEWCVSDSRKIFSQILNDEDFRAEKYNYIKNLCYTKIDEELEMLAEQYLEKGNAHCPPVPTELSLLADEQGPIEVRSVVLKTLRGALWRWNEKWIIYLNSSDSPDRMRFTLFHEVFHILAHCRANPTLMFRKRGSDRGSFNEIVAEIFPLYFLMPREWVKEKWAEVNNLDKMAEIFVVPKPAMWIRLKLLGLVV